MLKFYILALGIGAGLLLNINARAEEGATPIPPAPPAACIPIDQVIKVHKEKWNESPIAGGQTKDGGIVIFASPKGATWSVVAINESTGVACMISSGVGFMTKKQAVEGRDA